MLHRLNSAETLIQRTTTEAPQRRYVLHRTGCTQEDHQLLRKGRSWPSAAGRQGRLVPNVGCVEGTVFTIEQKQPQVLGLRAECVCASLESSVAALRSG